jgi:hypothetical protein
VDARGLCLVMGLPPWRDLSVRGKAVPGAALASPPPLREGATGAAASRPVCRPDRSARGPRRHERASWRRANGHRPDHQGHAWRPVRSPGNGQGMAPARLGEKCAPQTASGYHGCLLEPVNSASRPSDGLRPLLTEPIRPGGTVQQRSTATRPDECEYQSPSTCDLADPEPADQGHAGSSHREAWRGTRGTSPRQHRQSKGFQR